MEQPDDDDDFQPPKKKHSEKARANEAIRAPRRFASPVSDEHLSNAQERFIPGNTEKSTMWSRKVFVESRTNFHCACASR